LYVSRCYVRPGEQDAQTTLEEKERGLRLLFHPSTNKSSPAAVARGIYFDTQRPTLIAQENAE
jgi:hypothetical protein